MSTDEGRPGKDQDAPWTPSSSRPADPFEPDPSPADAHQPPKYDGPRGDAATVDPEASHRERMRAARAREAEQRRWDDAYGSLSPAQRWLEGADVPGAPHPAKYGHLTWRRDILPALARPFRYVWSVMRGK